MNFIMFQRNENFPTKSHYIVYKMKKYLNIDLIYGMIMDKLANKNWIVIYRGIYKAREIYCMSIGNKKKPIDNNENFGFKISYNGLEMDSAASMMS